MSVGANSISRVSKKSVDTAEKKTVKASTAKTTTAKTATAKTVTAKKKEETVEGNKAYCLTEELPYYLL